MTKYRKSEKSADSNSVTKSEKATETQKTAEKAVDKKETSGYNPETWTEQFFREKREREAIQKNESTGTATGQEEGKGIPDEKGIPACEV